MRYLIVGSRDFDDLARVREYVNRIPSTSTVISGAARGVDATAASAARQRGLDVEEYPADWQSSGRSAGFQRNVYMVDRVGDNGKVVAFWDGESKGTRHTINIALDRGREVHVYMSRKRKAPHV